MTQQIMVGTVVEALCGGPMMTVEQAGSDFLSVIWFADSKLQRHRIDRGTIRVVPEEERLRRLGPPPIVEPSIAERHRAAEIARQENPVTYDREASDRAHYCDDDCGNGEHSFWCKQRRANAVDD